MKAGVDHLAYFGGPCAVDGAESRFIWPNVDSDLVECAARQMRDTLSIYDRSSVFLEFETAFSSFHERKHSVLFNSGTSALHAAYDGFRLTPGDEVICGGYNFHASITPALQYGITPVFSDVDDQGNMDVSSLLGLITPNTKGVVVTHMWGNPSSDIERIARLCHEKGIFLLEDCSHSHGAKLNGKLVGTFGDVAVWSLQGQKVISGGEGGVLSTDSDEHYYNSILFGHYNKRPKTEIPSEHHFHKFAVTGKGLKLRAHPVAIAIALQQFRKISEILEQKALHAEHFKSAVSEYEFVRHRDNPDATPSWYAFTFNFDSTTAGITREQFVDLLIAEGMTEFDIPGSTGDITGYKLFRDPSPILPHLDWSMYQAPSPTLPGINRVHSTIIKLPVWGRSVDTHVVEAYCRGFKKVADIVRDSSNLSEKMQNHQK